jgi:hypothetical protein
MSGSATLTYAYLTDQLATYRTYTCFVQIVRLPRNWRLPLMVVDQDPDPAGSEIICNLGSGSRLSSVSN